MRLSLRDRDTTFAEPEEEDAAHTLLEGQVWEEWDEVASLTGAYSDTKDEVAQVRDIAESEDGASVDTDEEED